MPSQKKLKLFLKRRNSPLNVRANRRIEYRPSTEEPAPATKIYVAAARYTDGHIIPNAFEVRLDNPAGEVIVEVSELPMVDAAQALSSRGVTGRLELWSPGAAIPRMRADIELLLEAQRILRRAREERQR